jgi:lysine-ketoglutarate reductase/saccharopine dehydrogenase-like protein (TIGR00300 family)
MLKRCLSRTKRPPYHLPLHKRKADMVSEVVTLEGHIIDSKVLGTVLDDILSFGGDFKILEVHIGQSRQERSHARIEVSTETLEKMQELMGIMSRHGALWHEAEDAEIQIADIDGAFPTEFYSTTNQQTFIRHGGKWVEVQDQEMDCGLLHDVKGNTFRCIPIVNVKKGDRLVCGHRGIKVIPFERQQAKGVFEFMASDISTEKPKNTIIRNVAALMHEARKKGQKLLLVGGPAIVHTGAGEHVVKLIERGFIHVLFAGNALATHDIEENLFGTSLGVYLDKNSLAAAGHEHHLRAINAIRRAGGIKQAVEKGVLTGGIMHACVKNNVQFILAGSVRDDGPMPDVVTDMVEAQDRMRAGIKGVGFVLMVATTLHSVATGNILPAWIPAVCVDINPPVLTKLADRGSFQTIGLVTDVEPFFRVLLTELEKLG